MADELDELSPAERAAVLLARLRRAPATEPLVSTIAPEPVNGNGAHHFDEDLIPKIEYQRSEEDNRLDAVLDRIDVVDAYVRLIGKMQPNTKSGKTEGVMISCPMPNHPDKNPSAWINTDKGTWYCSGCGIGGDKFDLAAIHFGYTIPAYKERQTFPVLRRQLAEFYGYTVVKGMDTEYAIPATMQEPVPPPLPDVLSLPVPPPSPIAGLDATMFAPDPKEQERVAPVVDINTGLAVGDDEDEDAAKAASDLVIDWESLLPVETFLREWMDSTTIDDLPHEFYFWLGLMALGFCGPAKNTMVDFQTIKPNIYVCLYGPTGIGKSRALRPFLRLVEESFPFMGDPEAPPEGVRVLPTPGSAEALIDSFKWEIKDPSTGHISLASVAGLLRHEELSGLISRAARHGNPIKEVLMEAYDVYGGDISTHSRGSGIVKAHSPFCQMVSTTQPNAIHAFLRRSDIESGFLNRWIMAAGKGRRPPLSYGGVTQKIDKAILLLKSCDIWARSGHEFVLEGDALTAWDDFFQKELAPFKSGEKDQESIFSRIDLTLKKLIILFCINEQQDQPTESIVRRVCSLLSYLRVTYSAFSKDLAFNETVDCQAWIEHYIDKLKNKNGHNPSKRQLVRSLARKYNTETIAKAIRNMMDLGLLEEEMSPKGVAGRPTVRYKMATD